MSDSRVPARLIIVCGLPGSGKTTLACQYERELGAVRFFIAAAKQATGGAAWNATAMNTVPTGLYHRPRFAT